MFALVISVETVTFATCLCSVINDKYGRSDHLELFL